ncbi:MAG: DUF2141 domain-containing protein [Phycisphaerales bacterium]|nr:DUF2141 domain-containing protein [Phycisphaerales bacterium]
MLVSPWSESPDIPSVRSARGRFAAPLGLAVAAALVAGCQSPPVVEPDADSFETTTLRIEFETPNDADKQMKVAVVQSPDGWLKSTGWAAARSISVTPPLTVVEFENLPARPTAISVFIDVDEDNDLGRGAFGIPIEPYGFSNNVTVLFGPPRFGDATIELVPPLTTARIRIRSLSKGSDASGLDDRRERPTVSDRVLANAPAGVAR